MRTYKPIFLFTVCVLFFSCGSGLEERTKSLEAREQALAQQEKIFEAKQQEYLSLLKMRDSLLALKKADTLAARWPQSIDGLWSSKLVCTASSCSDYVIGDQKTNEVWSFSQDSSRAFVTVLNNKTLVRVYNGSYDTTGAINLSFKTDSTAKRPVNMHVLLDHISQGSMQGTQTISIDSSCTSKFSVELTRIQNN